jgi:hypothetical protein
MWITIFCGDLRVIVEESNLVNEFQNIDEKKGIPFQK